MKSSKDRIEFNGKSMNIDSATLMIAIGKKGWNYIRIYEKNFLKECRNRLVIQYK